MANYTFTFTKPGSAAQAFLPFEWHGRPAHDHGRDARATRLRSEIECTFETSFLRQHFIQIHQ
jgi:hypothetical protein